MKKIFFILLSLGFTLSFSANAQAACCRKPNIATTAVGGENTVTQAVKQENTETVKLKITGLTCAGCASHLHKVLGKISGVTDNSVEYPGDIALIQYDPEKTNPELIIGAIEKETSYIAELSREDVQDKN